MNLGDRIKRVTIEIFVISGKSRLSKTDTSWVIDTIKICCTDGRVWISNSALKVDIIRKMSWADLRYVQHKLVSKLMLNIVK